MTVETDRNIDAVGLFCPEPIIRLADAFKTMNDGQTLTITADDPGAMEDIPAWCRRTGNELLSIEQKDSIICAIIRKSRK